MVGVPPENLKFPDGVGALPASIDQSLTDASQRNPNVVASDYTARAANSGIDLIRGELLPSVSLIGDVNRSIHASTENSHVDSTGVTASVSVPLYQGGSDYARLRSQKHTAAQRRLEVDQNKRDAVQQATQAWEALESARARARQYRSQIDAAQIALTGVEEEFRVGSRTLLDVLDAEQELFDANVNLVRAPRDQMVSAFQLKSATGDMTAQALDLPVEIYDPTLHYKEVEGQWIGSNVDILPASR